jgi:hypothetical protein
MKITTLTRTVSSRLAAISFVALLGITQVSQATVVDWAYYPLGEPGTLGASNRPQDSVGSHHYTGGHGGVVSNDVSSLAAAVTGSTNSLEFTYGYYGTGGALPENNFGMEVWVKSEGPANGAWIWGNAAEGTVQDGIGFIVSNAAGSEGRYAGIVPGKNWLASPTAPMANDGKWHHLAIVRDTSLSTDIRFYVDGGVVATSNAIPNSGGSSHMGVNSGGATHFDGWLDEARVFTFNPGEFSTSDLSVNALNLLVNPSFEDNDPGQPASGWNPTGALGVSTTQGQSHGGRALSFNGGNTQPSGQIWQTFDTEAGGTYELTLDIGKFAFGTGTAQFDVDVFDGSGFLGTQLLDETVSDSTGTAPALFDSYRFRFLAAGPSTTLRILDTSIGTNAFDSVLDNLAVTRVPEPSGLGLAALGLLALLGTRLRRKT